jgi:hypothetical protein
MRILFVYSQHDQRQIQLIERVKQEMSTYVDEVQVMEVEEARNRFHIRATPAIIPICDHWQGEHLMAEGTDGQLLITATAYKLNEEEDQAIHQSQTHRLDNFVNGEKTKAIDEYTLQLLEGGVI